MPLANFYADKEEICKAGKKWKEGKNAHVLRLPFYSRCLIDVKLSSPFSFPFFFPLAHWVYDTLIKRGARKERKKIDGFRKLKFFFARFLRTQPKKLFSFQQQTMLQAKKKKHTQYKYIFFAICNNNVNSAALFVFFSFFRILSKFLITSFWRVILHFPLFYSRGGKLCILIHVYILLLWWRW